MLTWGRKFTETNARKERIRKESSGWVGRCLLPVVYVYQTIVHCFYQTHSSSSLHRFSGPRLAVDTDKFESEKRLWKYASGPIEISKIRASAHPSSVPCRFFWTS